MLVPEDYSEGALFHRDTRSLMDKITFEHGGPEYDEKYPDGIPTSLIMTTTDGQSYDSGLVMYPAGHARNTAADLGALLRAKWQKLAGHAADDPGSIIDRFNGLPQLDPDALRSLYDFEIGA